MTNITIKNGYFCASGHAMHTNSGPDIVCASVSTLSFTLLNALDESGILKKCRMEPGYMEIEYSCTDESRKIMGVILVGFQMVAENYPNNVQLTITGVET